MKRTAGDPPPIGGATAAASIADDLVLLASAPAGRRPEGASLDLLLAAADVADDVLAGEPLPANVVQAICGRRLGLAPVEEIDPFDPQRRAVLIERLTTGLRLASNLPLRLGFLAALASTGGVADAALERGAHESAQDVASGVVELVADPTGAVPALADGLREAISSLA